MDWFANRGQIIQVCLQIIGVVGSVLTVLTGVVQKLQSGSLDWWVLGSLFVLFLGIFVYAIGQSRRQRRSPDKSVIKRLMEHRAWAVQNLLYMPVQSDPDLMRWIEQRDMWKKRVVEDLRRVCSDAEVLRFDVTGPCPVPLHSNAYNDEHNLDLSMLDRDLKMLLSIVDQLEEVVKRYRS